MKNKSLKSIIVIFLLTVMSCNEPETIVTDYVHKDGSVTRVIEMRSISTKPEERFQNSDLQVPFDKTWRVKDSTELSKKGDTIWIRRADKLFKNVEEVNLLYKLDTGANKVASRHASFTKSFRWFNTRYRFTEGIDQKYTYGYPLNKYLNDKELHYFYSPETLKSEQERGVDSLKFKALADSVKVKTDTWLLWNVVSGWIDEFSKLTGGRGGNEISSQSLKAREDELVKLAEVNSEKFDSLWKAGVILKKFIGAENASKFETEADSALSIVTNNILINFKDYSVRVVMPGELTGTNGFIDSSKVLLWPVKSDYFLFQPYEMWAESKLPNRWAWIVSGLFLLFVLTGVIIRIIKRG